MTQGKELEWGQGGDGRTEGDDEAFAGQVQAINSIMRTIILIVLSFHSFDCLDSKFEIVLTRGASAKMTIRENMRYWKEEEVIKIRSTREEEVLKEEEEEEEHEEGGDEGKGRGRRHAKLVRQSRVKESLSPRSIR